MDFSTVFNYYERLVFNEIIDNYSFEGIDEDKLSDVACIALNNLPPKHIRNAIDMSFFMTVEDHIKTNQMVAEAVAKAVAKIESSDSW